MVENSLQLIPKFAVSFSVLGVFALVCGYKLVRLPTPDSKTTSGDAAIGPGQKRCLPYVIDWRLSKPIFTFGGLICGGLGIVSAMGSLLLSGIIQYNTIVSVMPFLVVSIGIDDMFIVLASWRKTAKVTCLRRRTQMVMADSAVSITITSATDALSFGIGAITTVPAVQGFCIFTAVSILFTYAYQLTFFSSLMVLCGIREERCLHCHVPCIKTGDVNEPQSGTYFVQSTFALLPVSTLMFNAGSSLPPSPTKQVQLPQHSDPRDEKENAAAQPEALAIQASSSSVAAYTDPIPPVEEDWPTQFFRYYFAPFILHWCVSLFVGVTLVAYLVFAIIGCCRLQEGLEPKNVIAGQHHAVKWYNMSEHYFWMEGPVAQVIVSRPPDFTSRAQRDKLFDMIHAFEGKSRTMAANATHFWLPDYLRYLSRIGYNTTSDEIDNDEIWGPRLYYWSRYGNGKTSWVDDLAWNKPNQLEESNDDGTDAVLSAFRFRIGLRNYIKPQDHRHATVLLRQIADSFPEYNVSAYHLWFPFVDQYVIIIPNTLQNIGIALICMVVIAALLIPDVPCAILVTLSIVSIDVGVIGYMTWWNVNLDAISMITVIMSIGFAVDLSAHISYAFTLSPVCIEDPKAAAAHALGELGWPVFQGAASTVLGVMILESVDAYAIVTFFKTVFLVMVFGLAHGLIFLPVCLTYGRLFFRRLSKASCFSGFSKRSKVRPKNTCQACMGSFNDSCKCQELQGQDLQNIDYKVAQVQGSNAENSSQGAELANGFVKQPPVQPKIKPKGEAHIIIRSNTIAKQEIPSGAELKPENQPLPASVGNNNDIGEPIEISDSSDSDNSVPLDYSKRFSQKIATEGSVIPAENPENSSASGKSVTAINDGPVNVHNFVVGGSNSPEVITRSRHIRKQPFVNGTDTFSGPHLSTHLSRSQTFATFSSEQGCNGPSTDNLVTNAMQMVSLQTPREHTADNTAETSNATERQRTKKGQAAKKSNRNHSKDKRNSSVARPEYEQAHFRAAAVGRNVVVPVTNTALKLAHSVNVAVGKSQSIQPLPANDFVMHDENGLTTVQQNKSARRRKSRRSEINREIGTSENQAYQHEQIMGDLV